VEENLDHPRPVAVEHRSPTCDARQFSPSAARNCGPIREVLTHVLPRKGIVLEIGSGTGEHAICFAKALPKVVWLPSDPDTASRATSRRGSRPKSPMCVRRLPSTCESANGSHPAISATKRYGGLYPRSRSRKEDEIEKGDPHVFLVAIRPPGHRAH
jgi:Protein of unknown function (DUF938)